MPLSPIAKGDVETFDEVVATNLRGTFLILAQAAQHVAEGGCIIAFSSSVLAKNFPAYGPYIASKAGVEGLVHVLANELRGRLAEQANTTAIRDSYQKLETMTFAIAEKMYGGGGEAPPAET